MSWEPFSKGHCAICGTNIGGLGSIKFTPYAGGYWKCQNKGCGTLLCVDCATPSQKKKQEILSETFRRDFNPHVLGHKKGLFMQQLCPFCGQPMARTGRWKIF